MKASIVIFLFLSVSAIASDFLTLSRIGQKPAIASGLVQWHEFSSTYWDNISQVTGAVGSANAYLTVPGNRNPKCLYVDGRASDANKFNTGNNTAIHGYSGYTISFWVYPTTFIALDALYGTLSGTHFIFGWMDASGKLVAGHQAGGLYTTRATTSNTCLVSNQWQYVTVTVSTNVESGMPYIYVNGVKQPRAKTFDAQFPASGFVQSNAFSLGRAPSAGLSGERNYYQHFTVYNRQLSDSEVWQLYTGWVNPL